MSKFSAERRVALTLNHHAVKGGLFAGLLRTRRLDSHLLRQFYDLYYPSSRLNIKYYSKNFLYLVHTDVLLFFMFSFYVLFMLVSLLETPESLLETSKSLLETAINAR